MSSIAWKTTTSDKGNKQDLIPPLTADLVKTKAYLKSAITELSDRLYAEPNNENYVNFLDCVVRRIILFNKRRGWDVTRMTREHYEKPSNPTTVRTSRLDDISKTLSQTNCIGEHCHCFVQHVKSLVDSSLCTEQRHAEVHVLYSWHKHGQQLVYWAATCWGTCLVFMT